jgi:hypothetical protein
MIVGVVKILSGSIWAISGEGLFRLLNVGDKIKFNDLISTSADGFVEIELHDGGLLDLGRSSQALIDEEVVDCVDSEVLTQLKTSIIEIQNIRFT